jgi:hypothetical protein
MTTTAAVPRPVPMHLWGKDHWSTFAYAAHVATSGKREIEKDKMRTDGDRHPHGVGHIKVMLGTDTGGGRYPTRLRHGGELHGHDDWDCLDDAVAAGLLTWGTWAVPFVVLTDAGLQAHAQVQAYENDPAVRSWTRAMEGWAPVGTDTGMAANGDALYAALHG